MSSPEQVAEQLMAHADKWDSGISSYTKPWPSTVAREAADLIRSLVRERDAVGAAYQKHIFGKGLTEDSLDPATLEGEVWFILHQEAKHV